MTAEDVAAVKGLITWATVCIAALVFWTLAAYGFVRSYCGWDDPPPPCECTGQRNRKVWFSRN